MVHFDISNCRSDLKYDLPLSRDSACAAVTVAAREGADGFKALYTNGVFGIAAHCRAWLTAASPHKLFMLDMQPSGAHRLRHCRVAVFIP